MAASATAAPETPPISVESTMQTCASPPAIHDTSVFEHLMSRVVMPEWFIMWPARMKNGTASSGKLCDAVATCCTPIETGIVPFVRKKVKPAMPIANAIGSPSSIRARKVSASSVTARLPLRHAQDRRRQGAAPSARGG